MDPVPSFNWVFEYESIATEMLIQPSRYKRAENNLQADEIGPLQWIQIVVWIIIYLNVFLLKPIFINH